METVRWFAKSIDSLAGICKYLEEFISATDLGARQAYILNLVTEEIFTNMVKYGSGSSADVEIRLTKSEKEVTLRLVDFEVAEFDLSIARTVDPDCPAESVKPGGLGLHLVRSLADKFEYDYIDGSAFFTVTIKTVT